MKILGRLDRWIQRGGFGFIRRDDGAGDVYVHVREFFRSDGSKHMPMVGDLLEFEILTDAENRPCAVSVRRVYAVRERVR